VEISRDYPLKTRTSKQPIREVPGYEIISFHPLKYPRSKQGLREPSKQLSLRPSATRKAGKQAREQSMAARAFWNNTTD
jgi:hypothetical protein